MYVLEDDVEWKKLIVKYVKAQRNLAAAKVNSSVLKIFIPDAKLIQFFNLHRRPNMLKQT